MLRGSLILVKTIEIDELLLDQVAFTLVVTVAASWNNWHFGLSQVGQHLLVICEDFYRVWQDLWKLQVSDVTSESRALFVPISSIRLEFPKCLQGCRQALSLLVYIVELVCQKEQISEELDCQMRVAFSELTIGAKKAVELVLDRVPALACLIERMHDREAIEAVIL